MLAHTFSTRRDFLCRTAALAAGAMAVGAGNCGESNAEARVGTVVGAPLRWLLSGGGSPGAWQIGIYTRPWAQFEYPAALDAIAEAGYRYVGLMTIKSKSRLVLSMENTLEEAQKIGQQAKQRGLTIISVYGGGFPVGERVQEAGIQGLKRLIDNVAACGCGELLLGGQGRPQFQAAYYATIKHCCDYAAEKNVFITIKPHGGLNATGPQCRTCCELVGHKNFGIWYDPGNILFYSDGKLDPVEDAATVDGLVRGMAVKDYRHPKRVDVTPGTGQVDFPKVLARLKQGGFTGGPLVVECLAPGDPKALVEEAKKARVFVEQLVSA